MRKLKLQVQTTIDGYMAGPNGEMDFVTMPWSDDVGAFVEELMASVDTIVLGRRLAEGFIPAWEAGPPGESQEAIDWMNDTPKVVITNSLEASPWANATVARGELRETIESLKAEEGGDLIAYGGGTLVAGLIAEGLVDEINLFLNPTSIGKGMPVFPDVEGKQPFRLVTAQPFECGITALRYEPEA